MPVCVVHTREEEKEGTLPASAESHHPAKRQIHHTICKQSADIWESANTLKAVTTCQTTGKGVSECSKHQRHTWPALCVAEEKWDREDGDCQGCHRPGCLMKACVAGAPWGLGRQRGGSQTPPVFSVSGLWAMRPEKSPGRTFGRYTHLQRAWWTGHTKGMWCYHMDSAHFLVSLVRDSSVWIVPIIWSWLPEVELKELLPDQRKEGVVRRRG